MVVISVRSAARDPTTVSVAATAASVVVIKIVPVTVEHGVGCVPNEIGE
jgi:hypothetical protein